MITASPVHTNFNKNNTGISIIETSQQLLLLAKTHEPTDSFVAVMKDFREEVLTQQLKDDNYKKTVWINVYNAHIQIILSKNPGNYKNRGSFFSDQQVTIAGKKLSLDDIEHGM